MNRHDIMRAIESLKPLGAGMTVTTFGHEKFLKTLPIEMSTDINEVLEWVKVLLCESFMSV
jgi:hypothetical protein